MQQNKLICQDWILSTESFTSAIRTESYTSEKYTDLISIAKELRIFGTEKQIEETSKNYSIDEVYNFKVEKKGSYWYKIYNNPEEENNKVAKKLEDYKKLYYLNDNKVLILRLK